MKLWSDDEKWDVNAPRWVNIFIYFFFPGTNNTIDLQTSITICNSFRKMHWEYPNLFKLSKE